MVLAGITARLRPRRPAPPIDGPADARWSVISSVHDAAGPDEALLDVALKAAERARQITLDDVADRWGQPDATWIRSWPGEHYRLLAALVAVTEARQVVEIGTFKGQGSLALASGSPDCHVITYDVVPWRDVPGGDLREQDLSRIEQRIGDLGDDGYRADQLDTLRAADLVFIDGPKDGEWEQRALPLLLSDLSDRRRLVVLDDIRLLEMVQLWRDVRTPKLDLTSFGHWSGTGLLWTA